ncbi:MAG TPA: ATP-binding protein [Fimbriimonadaceae bacterium]|jgi:hypothetical protein
MSTTIRPNEQNAIIQSLRAGVVPRVGLQHFHVGRKQELEHLHKDLTLIADGGSSLRFIIGSFGSGKTFFLTLMRTIAQREKLVTVHADLTPDRRLQASGGQARALYAELMRNAAVQTRPDGSALTDIVERFVGSARDQAEQAGISPEAIIGERLQSLRELVNGFDFASVIQAYWRAYEDGDENLKNCAIRWLRAEYATRTDARCDLGVRTIINDENIYDSLKLFARFVRLAGYRGLLVCFDELVNIYKMGHVQARNANYEQLLRMLNDTLQGTAEGIGFLLSGTPEFLLDSRRGAYSYEALASRLPRNVFAKDGLVDYSGPVINLPSLTPEDVLLLLQALRHVQAFGDSSKYLLPDEGIRSFINHCYKNVGEAYFRTPRTTITDFLNLLAVLEEHPTVNWDQLIENTQVTFGQNPDLDNLEDDNDLNTIRL